MNIHGCKNQIKKQKKKIAEIIKEVRTFEDKIANAIKKKKRNLSINNITYTIEEARTSLARLNYDLGHWNDRKYATEKKLKEEILKRKKRLKK